jgi:endo-1,4-beta-xylanase
MNTGIKGIGLMPGFSQVNKHFMKKNKIIFFLLPALLLLENFPVISRDRNDKIVPSLKKVFEKDFSIGTALNARQIEQKDPKAAELIVQQFNTATPENIIKATIIHPGWDTYNFDLADKMVAF